MIGRPVVEEDVLGMAHNSYPSEVEPSALGFGLMAAATAAPSGISSRARRSR
jgi:hypothetical protein